MNDKIVKNDSKWIINESGVYYPPTDYLIPFGRIEEPDWLLHLTEKGWFDMNEFWPVYCEALKERGLKQIFVTIDY